jgi:hypothetical protein
MQGCLLGHLVPKSIIVFITPCSSQRGIFLKNKLQESNLLVPHAEKGMLLSEEIREDIQVNEMLDKIISAISATPPDCPCAVQQAYSCQHSQQAACT